MLAVASGSVKSPESTYYTALSVEHNGVIDLTNQKELITAECLTLNGTIRVNLSLVDTSTHLTDVDFFKFTCSSTNMSSVVMDLIVPSECQSSYQIREKVVGRTRTVNADINVECPNNPNSSSNQPIDSNSPSNTNTPSSPTNPDASPQSTVPMLSAASSLHAIYAVLSVLVAFAS